MIVDFTIKNFRSIKEQQTFSLYAEKAKNHLESNIVHPDNGKIGVLRSAGIYGANASGKSNLLLAFQALRYITSDSGDLKDGDLIPCFTPFRLSKKTINAPIVFEIEFFLKKTRFIYSASFTHKKFTHESLDFYPKNKKANLFKREEYQSWEEVSFGAHYKNGRKKFAFFENNSYLSKAGNSADSPLIIREVYNYFRSSIFNIAANEKIESLGWKEYPTLVQKIAKILSKVDTGISGIEFEENEDIEELPPSIDVNRDNLFKHRKKKVLFIHQTEEAIGYFPESVESTGTRKLLNILPLFIEALNYGHIIIIDELESSFHPHIAELIIKIFNDSTVNVNQAQLIFTTHNINLMSPELLRRDQIWFTEKNDGATNFYSLDEYDKSMLKSNSPYGKWYEEGRFGAIPKINTHEILSILKEGLKDA
ncbi:MAG: AAA15 family ATPase/GTPase [bacterium]|jgi:AAA15 family ATPase/GTPase